MGPRPPVRVALSTLDNRPATGLPCARPLRKNPNAVAAEASKSRRTLAPFAGRDGPATEEEAGMAASAGVQEPPDARPLQKGLKSNAIGFASSVVIGVASTAPGYSLAAVLGLVVAVQ